MRSKARVKEKKKKIKHNFNAFQFRQVRTVFLGKKWVMEAVI